MQALIVACILGAMAFISLDPEPGSSTLPRFCFICGERTVADAVLNVAFYVPFGIAIGLMRIPLLLGVVAAGLLSASMEAGQLLIPGRIPSALDVLTNTAGATVGLLTARTLRWWMAPSPSMSDTLATAGAALFLTIGLATGLLTAPDLPRGTYVGQWVPSLGRYQSYGGSVQRVLVADYPLPSMTLQDSDEIREHLLSGAPLRIWATAGPSPSSLSPIFGLVRQVRNQLLLVGVSGDDLVLRIWQRGANWRLDRPSYHARGMMAEVEPGSDLYIEVWLSGRRVCASVNDKSDCSLAATLGDGWRLLANPSSPSPTVQSLATFAWLALLAFPVGFWLRASVRSLPALVLLLAAAAATPPLTWLGPTPPAQWIAIASGLAAGIGARRWLPLVRASAAPVSGPPHHGENSLEPGRPAARLGG